MSQETAAQGDRLTLGRAIASLSERGLWLVLSLIVQDWDSVRAGQTKGASLTFPQSKFDRPTNEHGIALESSIVSARRRICW